MRRSQERLATQHHKADNDLKYLQQIHTKQPLSLSLSPTNTVKNRSREFANESGFKAIILAFR